MPPAYERLEVWREARVLVRLVYAATAMWPANEQYALTSQTRRAAISIALNIAEGVARQGSREFRRHVAIALGSHSELECALVLAGDLNFASTGLHELEAQLQRTGKQLWRLFRSLSAAP